MGHRGRKDDPLYRARKLLVSGSEKITDNGWTKLTGLLDTGDPHGEVRNAWHANQTLRGIYKITDPEHGAATVEQFADEFEVYLTLRDRLRVFSSRIGGCAVVVGLSC